MASTPAPSLSTRGFVKDPIQKADQLLGWFFITRQAQDYLFRKDNIGIQQILAEHGQNPRAAAEVIQRVLEDTFKQYFASARVTCVVDEGDMANGTGVELRLVAEFVDETAAGTTAWRYNPSTSVFQRIASAVNDGVL